MNKIPGIYVISDMDNGKSYVGSSIDLNNRLNKHKRDLKNNSHSNNYLQNAYNKNHLFRVITLPTERQEDTLVLEQKLINEFIDTGTLFNIARDALAPMSGINHTAEAKEKISLSHLNIPLTEEHKTKLSEIARAQGRKPSEEALVKSIISNTGRIHTPEQREVTRQHSIKAMENPLAREHLSKVNLGIKHTPETIALLKERAKGRTFTEEAIKARIAATTGRVQTQEEKEKRALSNIGKKREGKALENIQNAGLNKSKPVLINDKEYRSTKMAAKDLGITPVTVTKRINSKSKSFINWNYTVTNTP